MSLYSHSNLSIRRSLLWLSGKYEFENKSKQKINKHENNIHKATKVGGKWIPTEKYGQLIYRRTLLVSERNKNFMRGKQNY